MLADDEQRNSTAKPDELQSGEESIVKRVLLVADPTNGLGMSIRGGSELKLSIFVSRVNPAGAADKAGLTVRVGAAPFPQPPKMPLSFKQLHSLSRFPLSLSSFQAGDMILEVNGVSFEGISHKDAVSVLISRKDLSILVKTNRALPRHRYYYDECSWENGSSVSSSKQPSPMTTPLPVAHTLPRAQQEAEEGDASASVGVGKRLDQRSVSVFLSGHDTLHAKLRQGLSESECVSVFDALGRYHNGMEDVAYLGKTLVMILNSPEKLKLMEDIRDVVKEDDVPLFDNMYQVCKSRYSALRLPGM